MFIDLTVENDDNYNEKPGWVEDQSEFGREECLLEVSDLPTEDSSNIEENGSDADNDVEDETLSTEEKVAKMLVDHWIDFKGCKHHAAVKGDDITGMEEFIKARQELLQQIPEFADPDFAQMDRLPMEARLLPDRNPEVEDEWEKYSESPLTHMESGEWKECQDTIGLMFTGGDESEDEEGITLDRYLEV